MKLIGLFIFYGLFSCQQSAVKKTELNTKKFESKSQEIKMETKPIDIKYEPLVTATPTTTLSSAIRKTAPNFGIIFSGGGARTWAHVGVLKEIQKYKFPVVSVAGSEWGAVLGAIYAQSLSSNEVEWEMSKFKSVDKTTEFIQAVFAKKTVSDMKAGFACPSLNIKSQIAYLLNRGNVDQFLPFCVSSPGLVKPYGQSIALMSDVSILVQHLKSTGVQKIILINVMTSKNARPYVKSMESVENQVWVAAATQLAKKSSGIDEIVEIDASDFGIDSFDERREIMAKGSELSYNQIKKIAEKYGL